MKMGFFYGLREGVPKRTKTHYSLKKYADIDLGLGASVVAHLVSSLPNVCDSNYHTIMDNFFTSHEQFLYKS